MGNLTHALNIRMPLEMKIKIMQHSEQYNINLTDSVLFILDQYFNSVSKENEIDLSGILENTDTNKYKNMSLELREESEMWQKDFETAETELMEVKKVNSSQKNQLSLLTKQNQEILTKNDYLNNIVNQFNSPVLNEVFKALNQKFPNEIKELPDASNQLCETYFNQFININQNV